MDQRIIMLLFELKIDYCAVYLLLEMVIEAKLELFKWWMSFEVDRLLFWRLCCGGLLPPLFVLLWTVIVLVAITVTITIRASYNSIWIKLDMIFILLIMDIGDYIWIYFWYNVPKITYDILSALFIWEPALDAFNCVVILNINQKMQYYQN